MKYKLRSIWSFLQKAFFLAQPYGRKKLLGVFLVILIQGLFQVVGVTSILPFLALASNPGGFRQSGIGEKLLSYLPDLTDNQLLLMAGLFAIVMLVTSNVLMLAGEMIRTRYIYGFGHWLRLRLLTRILRNPYSYFLQRNTGELLKKTTGDVMAYVASVLSPLMESIARIITVLFLLTTLVLVDPVLAFFTAVGFTAYYVSIFTFLKKRRKATSDALKMANRGAMKEIHQLLGGVKPIKVHGVEESFLNRFAKHSAVQASLHKWFPLYQNSPRYFIEPVAFGGMVALVLILSSRGDNFTDVLPTLGVMALIGYRLIPSFQLLYGSATGMTLMVHCLEEVYEEFVEVESERIQLSTRRERERLEWSDTLHLKDITFQYNEAPVPVIQGLDLKIKRNQFVAFVGSTGSGKSTVIDIIMGLHTPQSGGLVLDGKPIEQDLVRRWRLGIGYVPQEIFLLDDTIAANIAFGIGPDEIDMEQVKRVAEVAQIKEFIDSELPDGFLSEVGERGVRLSGGQRQRIGLARALYHKPSLLVLDEATSALDMETEAALMQAIEGLYGQITLVVIAHRLSTVQRADVIYRLDYGRVKDFGTFDELGLQG
ncbi:MAG: ABC transporter ATP-binding protein [Puniceicoccaceae bacterium]